MSVKLGSVQKHTAVRRESKGRILCALHMLAAILLLKCSWPLPALATFIPKHNLMLNPDRREKPSDKPWHNWL